MMNTPPNTSGPQSSSLKGIASCSICKQTSPKLTPLREYGDTAKLESVCDTCLQEERVMLCCRCQKFIVAYDGKPCEKTINAQQKGVLQWLCYDCRDACQPVTCLCGAKTIANTDGEIFVMEPELLNGQIYLCDICKKYEIKDTCHICKKMVVALGTVT